MTNVAPTTIRNTVRLDGGEFVPLALRAMDRVDPNASIVVEPVADGVIEMAVQTTPGAMAEWLASMRTAPELSEGLIGVQRGEK